MPTSSSSSSNSLNSSFFSNTPPPTTKSEAAAIRRCDYLPNNVKRRVLDATSKLSADTCLIRHTRDSSCYSHVLPRGTPEHIMSRLEYSWGMSYGQLNVDSSSNILLLSSDLHRSFHRDLWVLIPEDRTILRTYRRHKKRGAADNDFSRLIPPGPYRYKFVASRFLKLITINLIRLPAESHKESQEAITPERYTYPFRDFPTIVSHVHPRFIIYHAGHALSKRLYDFYMAREDLQNSIQRVLSIYRAWTKPIPSNQIGCFVRIPKLPKTVDRDDKSDSERSEFTRAERSNWRWKGRPEPDDPQVPESLERGTLLVLDALLPHDTSKDDSISRWLADIPTSPNKFEICPVSNIPLN